MVKKKNCIKKDNCDIVFKTFSTKISEFHCCLVFCDDSNAHLDCISTGQYKCTFYTKTPLFQRKMQFLWKMGKFISDVEKDTFYFT